MPESHLPEALRNLRQKQRREEFWRKHPTLRKVRNILSKVFNAFGTFSLYADAILGTALVLWILYTQGLLILRDAITLAVVLVLLELGLFFLERRRDRRLEAYMAVSTQTFAKLDKTLEALLEYLKNHDEKKGKD